MGMRALKVSQNQHLITDLQPSIMAL